MLLNKLFQTMNGVLDKINDPMINDLIEVVVDNPEKYDIENITFTIDLFAKAICNGAKRELIRYIPIEYTKCDWLNEVINR